MSRIHLSLSRFQRSDGIPFSLFNKHVLSKLANEKKQQSVLFPLCGKTLDMKAVLDLGHKVIGIEGSRTAVEQFFDENHLSYQVKTENDYEIIQVNRD